MGDIAVDHLIIGATFWGIGYAAGSKGSTLVIEKSIRLGHEFIDCFKFGDSWDCSCLTPEGEAFKGELKQRNILSDAHKPILQACCPMLSRAAAGHGLHLLLGTKLLSVEKTEKGYFVEAYNASGIMRIHAGQVLDTAAAGSHFQRKSINAMLDAGPRKVEPFANGEFALYTAERPDAAYLKFYVDKQDSLMTARQKLYDRLYRGVPELAGYRIVSTATVFDYDYSGGGQNSYGISGSFTNPVKAYDAGVYAGAGGGAK